MRDAATKHRLQLQRKASLIAGAVVVASLVLGAGGGYWWGWSSGRQSVETMERQIEAAFQSGPDGAEVWLRLMKHNDPRQAIGHCTGSAVLSSDGRHACSVPLWIDGPGVPRPTDRKPDDKVPPDHSSRANSGGRSRRLKHEARARTSGFPHLLESPH
jgi:hypothetical protein